MWTPSAYASWETPGPVFLCSTFLHLFRVPQTEASLRGGGVPPVRPAALYSEEEAEVQGRASGSATWGDGTPSSLPYLSAGGSPQLRGLAAGFGGTADPTWGPEPGGSCFRVGGPPGLPLHMLRGMAAGTLAFLISLRNSSCCVSASPSRESPAPRGPLAGKGHQEKM